MDQHETEIFTIACKRLSIMATKAPEVFGVTRQTFSSWIHGRSKIPRSAFLALLELENRDFIRTAERMEQIRETAQRITKAVVRDSLTT